jgi:hypothetical protein
MFNATFNNISVTSWRSALLVEETGGPVGNMSQVTDKSYLCRGDNIINYWQRPQDMTVLSTNYVTFTKFH